MSATDLLVSAAIGIPAYFVWWRVLHPRWPITCDVVMVVIFGGGAIIDLLERRWGWLAGDLILLAFSLARLRDDWRKRKRRKLAQKLGYKARALRAKLVKTMKERRQPRRVLRPSPAPA